MNLTAYHAKYYALELTRRFPAGSGESVYSAYFDTGLDLNPHQIEAACFAYRPPWTNGVILADEGGLGKAIEAGIVLAQLHAERKRRLLVICPASLRMQWLAELTRQFKIPCRILDETEHRQLLDAGEEPFSFDGVTVVSMRFAHNFADAIADGPWDLIVIDEAHRLRKLYREDNKIGRSLQAATAGYKTLLLTAAPLQTSLMELYALSQLIDERIFPDEEVFRSRYVHSKNPDLEELRDRLGPYVQRTLRRDVLEYVRFTNRQSMTINYEPSPAERKFYAELTDYFFGEQQRHCIPASVAPLLRMFMRKVMASSLHATVGLLETLAGRLESFAAHDDDGGGELAWQIADSEDFGEEYRYVSNAIGDGGLAIAEAVALDSVQEELAAIGRFIQATGEIQEETKAKALLTGLEKSFENITAAGAPRKALIFTESHRTQMYLKAFLETNGYADKLAIYNGKHDDELSRKVYRNWKKRHASADQASGSRVLDIKTAMKDYFADEAEIMIATESAAEGLDFQFCALVINYDLPWNPQRLEWRISRCHRYGQKHDVVVLNFLDTSNAADRRVYQLLKSRFKLFDGVFGASDEVIGSISSGVDFEKRLGELIASCRTEDEIEAAFKKLQEELAEPIENRLGEARRLLLETFDEDVRSRFKLRLKQATARLDKMGRLFWESIKYHYGPQRLAEPWSDSEHRSGREVYRFDDDEMTFAATGELLFPDGSRAETSRASRLYYVDFTPHPSVDEYTGPSLRKRRRSRKPTAEPFPLHGVLAKIMFDQAKETVTPAARIRFDLLDATYRTSLMRSLAGKTGWLRLDRLIIASFEETDHLLWTLCDEDGHLLPAEIGEGLFALPGAVSEDPYTPCPFANEMQNALDAEVAATLERYRQQNDAYFDAELFKLDHWAEDLKQGLELQVERLTRQIGELNAKNKKAKMLKDKLALQKDKADLEKQRNQKRRELLDDQAKIEQKRANLVQNLEATLKGPTHTITPIFKIQWEMG